MSDRPSARATYVQPPTAAGTVVLVDVTVLDTVDGGRTPHQDVRIENGSIVAVGPTGSAPTDATAIALSGHYVVPGFVDAHAHPLNRPDQVEGAYALMLANGVTAFRQMSGSRALLADRAAGRLPEFPGAPELLATSAEVLTPLNAGSAEAARATVREQHALGADFVKAALTAHDGHLAALDEARRIGIPLAGHLPNDVDPREAAALGMRSIEHLGPGVTLFAGASDQEATIRAGLGTGPRLRLPAVRIPGADQLVAKIISTIVVNPMARASVDQVERLSVADGSFDETRARELAREFVRHETWQCPTLIRMHTQQFPDAPEHAEDPRGRYMLPRELASWRRSTRRFSKLPAATQAALRAHWAGQLRLTWVFDEENVPMLTGSDACGAGWVIPGFALHDEFDLLAEAGVSPLRILQAATLAPARFFGLGDVAGVVEVGRRADLVVLGADPVVDHANLHDIAGVVRAGGWWSRSDLDGVLARVEADPRTV